MDQSPGAKALSTDLIRHELLQYLDAADLLRCRLVCRTWSRESTNALLRFPKFRRALSVSISYSPQVKNYVVENKDKSIDLAAFRQILGFSVRFPVTFYVIEYRDLADSPIFDFLCDPQVVVHSLSLYNHSCWGHAGHACKNVGGAKIETLYRILDKRRDSLEYLHLILPPDSWGQWYDIPPPSGGLHLPKLRTFKVSVCYDHKFSTDILRIILRSAPHLKKVDGLTNPIFLETIVQEGRVETIKSWSFGMNEPASFSFFEKNPPTLSTFDPTMSRDLNIDLHLLRLSTNRTVEKVLDKSRDSLHTVVNFLPLILCPNIDLPVMGNVTKLTQKTFKFLRLEHEEVVTAPAGQTKRIFPRARYLKIGNDYLDKRDFDFDLSLLEGYGLANMTSVFHLDVNLSHRREDKDKDYPLIMIRIGRRMCPNVTRLDIRAGVVPPAFPKILQELWRTLPKLVWICFYFQDDEHTRRWEGPPPPDWLDDEGWLSQVDGAITGFDAERCKMLKENLAAGHGDLFQPGQTERSFPSILDCKNLQYFSVKFVGDEEVKIRNLFSQVAFIYGFDLMQNFRLNLDQPRPTA